MSSTQVGVWSDVRGSTVRVGTAWIEQRGQTISTTFTYADSWLSEPGAYAIDPHLDLSTTRHHLTSLPGALADSAPDRWGRNLIRTMLGPTAPGGLLEVDFLLGVSDLTRQGALRFTTDDAGTYLAPGREVPRLLELPRLLRASERVVHGEDSFDAVKMLLDAGSGSLGGARPKASVRDGDTLAIAKFPDASDAWDVMAWEATALGLAERAGIRVPRRRLLQVEGRHVLVLERFDRDATRRVPYLSALTLVNGTDRQVYDYLEVAEALAAHGGRVADDLTELWRRIAFSILVNNTDDHLRNHGFLRGRHGWRLAPVFDVNPNPTLGVTSQTTIGFTGESGQGKLEALRLSAPDFGLSASRANGILREMADAVSSWRTVATTNGVARSELDLFSGALDSLSEPR
ncbi:MAG: type II toxin-antitoxin system HipA family toxin [Propionibacteriaceae bacterium]